MKKRTILLIGSVTAKQYRDLRHELRARNVKPLVTRATLWSTSVTVGNEIFSLTGDLDPENVLPTVDEMLSAVEAEARDITHDIVKVLSKLPPISMVVMDEPTWQVWGSQMGAVGHMLERSLVSMFPCAEYFVAHNNRLPELV